MFDPNVEYWRPYFEGKGIPVDYMLYWIQRESDGNPCNITTSTGKDEIGLMQLMVPNDTDLAGTDEATLRAACVPGSSQIAHDLTQDDIDVHVSTSVDYLNALRQQAHDLLDSVGASWDESTPDFWAMVKLFHAAPAWTKNIYPATVGLGHPPANWQEFVQFTPGGHWTDVSWQFGQYAAGFTPPIIRSTWKIVAIGLVGLAIGIVLYERRASIGFLPQGR